MANLKYVAMAGLAALAACVEAEPIVSDFNGDSVTIVTSDFDSKEYQLQTSKAEADRICGKVKRRAEYASTRHNSQTYENANLYLCL